MKLGVPMRYLVGTPTHCCAAVCLGCVFTYPLRQLPKVPERHGDCGRDRALAVIPRALSVIAWALLFSPGRQQGRAGQGFHFPDSAVAHTHCRAPAALSSMRRRRGAGERGRLLASLVTSARRASSEHRQGCAGRGLRPTLVALLFLLSELGVRAWGDGHRPAGHPEETPWRGASRPHSVQWREGSQATATLPLGKSKSSAEVDHGALQLSPQKRQPKEEGPQLALVQRVPSPASFRHTARRSEDSSAGARSEAFVRKFTRADRPRQQELVLSGRKREGVSGAERSRGRVAAGLPEKGEEVHRASGALHEKGVDRLVAQGWVPGQRLATWLRGPQGNGPASVASAAILGPPAPVASAAILSPPASVASAAILGPTRSHKFDLTDFGAKGDGTSDNTRAFQNAMYALSSVADKGGGQLFIPPGRYLTGCFNLTSSMTLFLAKGAIVMANPEVSLWPVLPPLPSYGRGREMPGPRFSSFIYGQNLSDVIITGDGGVVDGMGSVWWQRARAKQLNYSRGPLMQFLWSTDVIVANITLLNSSYWALHPVYSRNVTLGHLKIIAPDDSPNTGGIFPDSCHGVLIEGVQIRTGGDCVDIKSGWDEYGIQYNQSSADVVVRGCHLQCVHCTALSIGSEMSGGVRDVLFEDVRILESQAGFRLKTSPGRGGYVQGIALRNIVMEKVEVAISFLPMYGQHADDRYDPTALPLVANFTFENVTGCEISQAGILEGLPTAPFRQINITHVHLDLVEGGQGFSCRDVNGTAQDVIPAICKELQPSIRRREESMGLTQAE